MTPLSAPRGNYPYAYGRLDEAVRLFLDGATTRDQLAAYQADIHADLHDAPGEAAS